MWGNIDSYTDTNKTMWHLFYCQGQAVLAQDDIQWTAKLHGQITKGSHTDLMMKEEHFGLKAADWSPNP